MSRLVSDEMKEWMPWLIEPIIASAVSMLPENERDRREEEWRSHFNEVPGQLGKLGEACSLLLGARKIRASLAALPIPGQGGLLNRAFDIAVSSFLTILDFPLLVLFSVSTAAHRLRRDSAPRPACRHEWAEVFQICLFQAVRGVGRISTAQ